jgi:cysteine desulfurase
VLAAMGVQSRIAEGALRVSTGWNSTDADINTFLAGLAKIYGRGREARAA